MRDILQAEQSEHAVKTAVKQSYKNVTYEYAREVSFIRISK